MSIDDLIARAAREVLADGEMQGLCDLAAELGRSEEVLIKLLTAGTVAGRQNLTRATALISKSKKKPTREELLDIKHADYQVNHEVEGFRFGMTAHALQRYIERYGGTVDDLKAESMSASPVKGKTINGEEQWVGPSGVMFVLKRDGGCPQPVCVTILPREEDKKVGHIRRPGKSISRRARMGG